MVSQRRKHYKILNKIAKICLFHSKVAMVNQMGRLKLDEEEQLKLLRIIHQMCTSPSKYLTLHKKMASEHPRYIGYFNKEWYCQPSGFDPCYYYWASICREYTYANGGTNNDTEYQFNLLQKGTL
jgi:hypothetical protein